MFVNDRFQPKWNPTYPSCEITKKNGEKNTSGLIFKTASV